MKFKAFGMDVEFVQPEWAPVGDGRPGLFPAVMCGGSINILLSSEEKVGVLFFLPSKPRQRVKRSQ